MALAGLILGYMGVALIPVILIVAAIAIPNFLRAKKFANEAMVISSLQQLNTAMKKYSFVKGGYPEDLEALDSPLVDPIVHSSLGLGRTFGYEFVYHTTQDGPGGGQNSGYTINANPLHPGTAGSRYFFTDQTGIIREDPDSSATANSPPVNGM